MGSLLLTGGFLGAESIGKAGMFSYPSLYAMSNLLHIHFNRETCCREKKCPLGCTGKGNSHIAA